MEPLTAIEEKAKRVLAITFRGIHHVPGWDRRKVEGTHTVSVIVRQELATYDYDELTRLVIAAHDECVRVELSQGGPRHLKLWLSERKREGLIYDRHPTIEEAIAKLRERA